MRTRRRSPRDFATGLCGPAAAAYRAALGEFLLMYDDVRAARSPSAALRDFCESTYAAGADLAQWNRAALGTRPKCVDRPINCSEPLDGNRLHPSRHRQDHASRVRTSAQNA